MNRNIFKGLLFFLLVILSSCVCFAGPVDVSSIESATKEVQDWINVLVVFVGIVCIVIGVIRLIISHGEEGRDQQKAVMMIATGIVLIVFYTVFKSIRDAFKFASPDWSQGI